MNKEVIGSDYSAVRSAAIRFWERRRWIYLIVMIPPSVIGYAIPAGFAAGIGDPIAISYWVVAWMFFVAFIGANVCYSFVYALEFLFIGTRFYDRYRSCRGWLLVLGCIIGVLLAANYAKVIALTRYPV